MQLIHDESFRDIDTDIMLNIVISRRETNTENDVSLKVCSIKMCKTAPAGPVVNPVSGQDSGCRILVADAGLKFSRHRRFLRGIMDSPFLQLQH